MWQLFRVRPLPSFCFCKAGNSPTSVFSHFTSLRSLVCWAQTRTRCLWQKGVQVGCGSWCLPSARCFLSLFLPLCISLFLLCVQCHAASAAQLWRPGKAVTVAGHLTCACRVQGAELGPPASWSRTVSSGGTSSPRCRPGGHGERPVTHTAPHSCVPGDLQTFLHWCARLRNKLLPRQC